MPQSTNHRRIRSLLDDLKPFLAAFVTSIHRRGEYELAGADTQGLLNVIINNWDAVFSKQLTRTSRSYVFELKDIRNRWAHEVEFSDDVVRRAGDTAALLAASIGAPANLVARLREEHKGAYESEQPAPGAHPPAKSKRGAISQRDMMRQIFARFTPDDSRIIREYAAAEMRGEVLRRSNSRGLEAEEYARRLLEDGYKKGWLSGD